MPAFPEIGEGTGTQLSTSSGVAFEYQFENYREQWTNRASNSTILARCAWEDAGDFLEDVLGYTTGVNGQNMFNRYLPLRHPTGGSLFCTDATLVKYPSSAKADANQPSIVYEGFFEAGWAVYQLTFTRLPYFVASNDTVSGDAIPELARYCVPADRPRAREFTVNSYALEVEATGLAIKQPAFIMDREQDLFVTLCEVPTENFPATGINNCLGKINNTAVLMPISFEPPSTFVVQSFPQDTLLFRGLSQEIHRYQGGTGRWYKDCPYFFTYRPGGWRKLPNPSGDGSLVVVKYKAITPTKYLYDRVEFNQLFRPEA